VDRPTLQLAIYTADGDRTLPLAEFLIDPHPPWRPSLDDATIMLWADERELLADNWNLGNLGVLTVELEQAGAALAAGASALIRSAVDDRADVPFVLFEPVVDSVLISLFLLDDRRLQAVTPFFSRANDVAELVEYVREHQARLLGPDGVRQDGRFTHVRTPLAAVLKDIQRETHYARQLYELLAMTMPSARS
jgi:hypothetical protein